MIRLPGNWKLRHIERVYANKHRSSEENMPVVKKKNVGVYFGKTKSIFIPIRTHFTKPSSPSPLLISSVRRFVNSKFTLRCSYLCERVHVCVDANLLCLRSFKSRDDQFSPCHHLCAVKTQQEKLRKWGRQYHNRGVWEWKAGCHAYECGCAHLSSMCFICGHTELIHVHTKY